MGAIAFTLVSGPATAGTIPIPNGCTAYLTVQQRQCLVTHHYICEGDPAGHQWRVDVTDAGMTYAAKIDAETQWVYSLDLFGGREETLVDNPADPASFSSLLDAEIDTYDFQTQTQDGVTTRFYGFDRINGTTAIDEVDLLTSDFEITSEDADGAVLWSATGNQYVSPEFRMFFFGTDTTTIADGAVSNTDHTPVNFIFPGEQGFLSDTPDYDCNTTMSRWDAQPDAADLMEVSQ
ncbi:MAG: hypothetical protein ACPG5U_05275 [Planktomarina sp.]